MKASLRHLLIIYSFLDDRRLIRASAVNLSRGLARPYANLLKKGLLWKFKELVRDYVVKEGLREHEGNIIKDKLFILFPESDEKEVCTIRRLREIEKNYEGRKTDPTRREWFSVSVNPIIVNRRDKSSGTCRTMHIVRHT